MIPYPPAAGSRQRGFTLIELLIVIAIMVALFGMAFGMSRGQSTDEAVRGAAEELGAVMRETRTRAMRANTPYGLVFNICNAPGSNGKILNNRSGGHWYRVIGPRDLRGGSISDYSYVRLPFVSGDSPYNGGNLWGSPNPLRHYLDLVNRSWVDEAHPLPKGKVRFLALTDQDNGNNNRPGGGGWYSPTYPRPWFGWWDKTTQNLYTWGGYDTTLSGDNEHIPGNYDWNSRYWGTDIPYIRNGHTASPSGFYYEGWDGPITGCVNPVDKVVLDDVITTPGSVAGKLDDGDKAAGTKWTAWRAGEPRPLINASWLDYVLVFRPDGTVSDDWFRMRNHYRSNSIYSKTSWDWSTANVDTFAYPSNGADYSDEGPGDRTAGFQNYLNWNDPMTADLQKSRAQREATSYVDRTGFFWITMAADVPDDRNTFPTALAALRSMLPIYRIGISLDGQVRVIRVNTTNPPTAAYPAGRKFDTTITGADWQNKNKIWGITGAWKDVNTPPITQSNYLNHMLNRKDLTPLGSPVQDTVLPEMLEERKWWWE